MTQVADYILVQKGQFLFYKCALVALTISLLLTCILFYQGSYSNKLHILLLPKSCLRTTPNSILHYPSKIYISIYYYPHSTPKAPKSRDSA